MTAPRLAYTQARLQARHGRRPDETTWSRLASTRELGAYLQQARATVLAPWVEAFSADTGVHALERELRRQYRAYVVEVAAWLPTEWRPAVRWVTWLPVLPALDHLQRGVPAPAWMTDDAALGALAVEDPHAREQALRDSDAAPLADAPPGPGHALAWLEEWRRRLPPGEKQEARALERIADLLLAANARLGRPDAEASTTEIQRVESALRASFRREAQRPAAAFAHLGLIAIDLIRLRGALTGRALLGAEAAA